MAATQQFRTSFRGFHRQDVVQYLEYVTNKHKNQIEQLNTQLQNTKEELDKAKAAAPDVALQQQLEEALARCAELEAKLADLKKDLFTLRMQHATNQLDNPLQIAAVKKEIARVKTILREKELRPEA